MNRPDYERHITAPLHERIAQLERILRDSPCHLVVKNSDEMMTHMGYGDRVMALEIRRLRGALEKIADGTVADKDIPGFAVAALDD